MTESTKDLSSMQDFEKLGQFYLGKVFDLQAGKLTDELVLYDSKDLCTHAVVVGMTGSGKTGLCIGLLEEAGMDRIPAIVIDPKGDISNLLLTFPHLTPEEFRPWIDESQAVREGMSPAEFATSESQKWTKGLASWGQDSARIRAFRSNVELRLYTPGSDSGRPLTILKNFAAPSPQVLEDSDMFRERISSAASGLLALLGINADPIRSKEHILVSKILEAAWLKQQDLDLGKLIGQIQSPPFDRVGIMDLDTFYPGKDRMELAMTMNNLLASPSFASWMSGEPLDIKRMLHTEEGKPCISVLSIAHLTEKERMFFVTILLNEILSWMRSQPGTSSLRAIFYMDEVFGYFPPTQNPPSKQPMLTMLKQARAYGLGVVLATQNPVDLDYKGLSNTGTWFLGRLQTERDKMRVLEGLEGAASQVGNTFDRQEIEQILAGLGSRRFLMNNVHDEGPVVFETKWVMSYLRGPLTRNQIQELMIQNGFDPKAPPEVAHTHRPSAGPVASSPPEIDPRQLIPHEVSQLFVEPAERLGQGEKLLYRPALLGTGRLHYVRASYKIDVWEERTFLAHITGDELPNDIWDQAQAQNRPLDLDNQMSADAQFANVEPGFQNAQNYKSWEKEFKLFLYRQQTATLWKCRELKQFSELKESEGDFKVRLEQLVSEKRDKETEKLRKKFAKRFTAMRAKIRGADDRVEREEAQYKQSSMNSYLNIGSTIMGALLGRRSTRATTTMRSYGRASKEKDDVYRAKENMDELQGQFRELEHEFNDEMDQLADKISVDNLELEELSLRPRKSDISVEKFAVCWLPCRVDSSGIAHPVY